MQTARLIRICIIALLVLVAVLACGFVWLRFQRGNIMSVQSGSMEPVLSRGDLVVVIQKDTYEVGDIITYTKSGATITHRLRSIETGPMNVQYRTQGDANRLSDEPIRPSAVVGSVYYTIPLLGYVADVMRSPAGLLVLIYLPALLIVAGELRRLRDYYKIGHYSRYTSSRSSYLHPVFLVGLLLGLGISSRAIAAFESRAILSSTTIRSIPLGSDAGVVCETNNTVNVSSTTSQSASSGSVTTTGQSGSYGTASSGSASNSSSSTVSISVANTCP